MSPYRTALMDAVILEAMARIVHACWVSFQIAAGQPYNEEPDDDDLASNKRSIVNFLENPDRTPEQSHEMWMADRLANGWVYGSVKDKEKKTHPDLVPYDQLPEIEKRKDASHIHSVRFAVNLSRWFLII